MATLKDQLLIPARRPGLVDDCVHLVDQEVSSKGGLSGLAVKGAYAVVKKIKPGIVREAIDKLLDEFVQRMEPFYAEFVVQGANTSLPAYMTSRSHDIASALLGVTDARAARADNRTIKAAYEKLRPSGVKHVEAAIPGMAKTLAKHLPAG